METLTSTTHCPEVLLRAIFGANTRREKHQAVPKSNRFLAIFGSNQLRWILPMHPGARHFMGSWAPQGRLRGLAWEVARVLHHAQLSRILPGVQSLGVSGVRISEWTERLFGHNQPGLPAIYVGAQGPRRKAVVGLVNGSGCENVAKIPLGPQAATAIQSEAQSLIEVQALLPGQVPQLIRYDEQSRHSVQSFVPQPVCFNPWSEAHSQIMKILQTTEATSLHTEIAPLVDNTTLTGITAGTLLSQCPFDCLHRKLPVNRVHGDFIPWNLKLPSEGPTRLSVIDWEYYRPRGLPLSDFAFFIYFTQDFLAPNCASSHQEFLTHLRHRGIQDYTQSSQLQPPDLPWILIASLIENAAYRRQVGHGEEHAVTKGLLHRATGLLSHLKACVGKKPDLASASA